MKYQRVCLEAFGYSLPEEVILTSTVEQWLDRLYQRLNLPDGRLEKVTGIRERRFFPPGVSPSEISAKSVNCAIQNSGLDKSCFGALIHGSVCRDYIEPSTACVVHHAAKLPQECMIYDVSNACLGIVNGMLQVANMIELGQISAGVVVGTECGRSLVENTINHLNTDQTLTRETIKDSLASLTIGSASVAVVLCVKELSQYHHQLHTSVVHSNTEHYGLCKSKGLAAFMQTDSKELLKQGVATIDEALERFLVEANWSREDITKTITHQIGAAHRMRMFETLGLSLDADFSTIERLGNTGAAALPVTMALAIEDQFIDSGDRVAMLSVGSGISSQIIGVDW